jgi:hypothetical protein
MPNPDYPPWMGPQQPGPPPGPPSVPPPGQGWPGPPPPPRQGSGFLTAIGVLNLVFSLLCGCVSLTWAATWAMLEEDPDQIAAQINTGFRKSMEISLERGAREKDSAAVRAIAEEASKPESVRDLLLAASASPASSAIRTATMAAGLAQAGLFVGSILLLMRKNSGRVLSMLALLVFIAATIATFVKFSGPAQAIGEELKTKVTAAPGYQALAPDDRADADQVLTHSPEILQSIVVGVSAFTMAWPAIALLILFASKSIKEACAPAYAQP